jgi:hydrogenase maturation protease
METLILGLGNDLLGDEGTGVHACRLLQERELPEGTRVVIAGTAILDVIPDLEQAEKVVVVDAMKGGEAPGSVYRIPFEYCRGAANIGSMHGFDMFRVTALLDRVDPPSIVVFGVEPGAIEWSLELTRSVRDSLPILLEAIMREL